MAIHLILTIFNKDFPNEPAHIFTDCLNDPYMINDQIKHPTLNNNHPDKTVLEELY